MNKSVRDVRQEEFAKRWIDTGKHGILNLCPRFGKIRTTIKILEQLDDNASILIAYPDNKIKASWEADFEELGYNSENVTYTTHLSLHKHASHSFDIVIIDEIHLLSDNQIEVCKEMFSINPVVLGLTGTLSRSTEVKLEMELDIHVVAEYSIEKAIEEGVIVDYEINVIRVPLDDVVKQSFNGKVRTEKQQFKALSFMIDKLEQEGKNTMFLRLARMRIIQNSVSKLNKTKKILSDNLNERILVFCGVTKIADKLGIPSFHSKSTDKKLFQDFSEGKGNHMAVVKIGNSGVTYKPLDKVIINYFDSNSENLAQKINRCMAYEFGNPEKKAKIYIISSNEPVELKWLKKALEFFEESKIKYL